MFIRATRDWPMLSVIKHTETLKFKIGAHLAVALRGEVVQDDKEEVESGEQGVWEVDIAREGLILVVGAVQRVGCGDHTAAGVEGGLNACLGDCHCLLLHHLIRHRKQ